MPLEIMRGSSAPPPPLCLAGQVFDGDHTSAIIMNTPQEAIQLAAKTVPRVKPAETRIVRIRDTLTLGEILVSEPMLAEVERHPQMEQAGQPQPFLFDDQGNPLAA